MMVLHKIEVNKEVYSITSQHNLFSKKTDVLMSFISLYSFPWSLFFRKILKWYMQN